MSMPIVYHVLVFGCVAHVCDTAEDAEQRAQFFRDRGREVEVRGVEVRQTCSRGMLNARMTSRTKGETVQGRRAP